MDSKDVLNELHAARMIAKQALLEKSDSGIVYDRYGFDKSIIFLLDIEPDASGGKGIETIMNGLCAAVEAEYRIKLTVSIGVFIPNPCRDQPSYFEARRTLGACRLHGWPRDTVAPLHAERDCYSLLVDLELRLMNALKLGDASEVKRMMASFSNRDFMGAGVIGLDGAAACRRNQGHHTQGFQQKWEMETGVLEELQKQALHIQLD